MFENSILGKIPAFVRLLCAIVANSAVYRGLSRAWHGILNAARESVIFRSFFADNQIDGAMNTAWSVRLIQGCINGIFSALRKLYSKLADTLKSSVFGRFYNRVYRHHWSATPAAWLGLFVLVMLAVPHDYWANTYGLLGVLALFFVWSALVIAGKRNVFSLVRPGVPFWVFAACFIPAVLRAPAVSDAIRVLIFFITAFALYLLVVAETDDADKLRRLLGFLFLGIFFTAMFGFVQRIMGVSVDASLTDVALNPNMPGRVFSTFENPNNYAELLVLTMPLCFVFCIGIKNRPAKVLSFVMLACIFGALLMTYSRSCWVSFALAAAVFIFLYDKRLLPLALVVGLAAIPLLPSSILDRILTIGSQNDTSNAYRIFIWDAVLQMIKWDWFTGVGLGPDNFKAIYTLYADPYAITAPHSHMLYLELWVELGLTGLIAFFWLMFDLLRSAVRAAKRTAEPFLRYVLYACVSSFVGIAFSCIAEYIWFYPRVLLAFFLVAGILKAAVHICNKKELPR